MAKHNGRITMSRAFLEGLARIFDPFSNLDRDRYRTSFDKSVTEQLRQDWITIGRDMETVFDMFEEQEKEKLQR